MVVPGRGEATALGRFDRNVGRRLGFLLQNSRDRKARPAPGKGIRTHSAPRSPRGPWGTSNVSGACPTLPNTPSSPRRGRRRGQDGPEGRQQWRKLKEPMEDPRRASPARGSPGAPGGGPRSRPARVTPPPGFSRQIFFFFFFCFSSCRPAPGSFARKTAPSLSCGRARRRPAPPPRSADLRAPAFCPRPPQPCPLSPAPSLSPCASRSQPPTPKEQPETAARSPACARRGRAARPPAAGLGGAVPDADAAPPSSRVAPGGRGGFLAQAAGREGGPAGQAGHCPPAGGAARSPPRARTPGRAAYPGPQEGPPEVQLGLQAG